MHAWQHHKGSTTQARNASPSGQHCNTNKTETNTITQACWHPDARRPRHLNSYYYSTTRITTAPVTCEQPYRLFTVSHLVHACMRCRVSQPIIKPIVADTEDSSSHRSLLLYLEQAVWQGVREYSCEISENVAEMQRSTSRARGRDCED